jgi:hypothetical protein
MGALGRVESNITAWVDGPSTFNEGIPDNVKHFAMSRIKWGKARGAMREQLDVSQSEIIAARRSAVVLQAVTNRVANF